MPPPLAQFFADAAWGPKAAFSKKTGGEGRFTTLPSMKAPSSGLSATFSPEGEKGVWYAVQSRAEQLDD